MLLYILFLVCPFHKVLVTLFAYLICFPAPATSFDFAVALGDLQLSSPVELGAAQIWDGRQA